VAFGPEVTVTENDANGETGFVTIPQGSSSTTFSVIGMPLVNFQTTNVVASRASVNMSQSISVNPLQVTMTLSPSDILGGAGNSSTGQITIPQPIPVNLTFALSSNLPGLSLSTTTATILAGNTTTTDGNGNVIPSFIATPPNVTTVETATITATWDDFLSPPEVGTVSSQLTIQPTGIISLVFMPDAIKQRTGPISFTITLSGNAPAGGLPITLSQSGNFIRGLPSTVTVPAGASTLTMGSYDAGAVSRTIADTITATDPFGGVATAVVVIER
jgi:hypothetical protein